VILAALSGKSANCAGVRKFAEKDPAPCGLERGRSPAGIPVTAAMLWTAATFLATRCSRRRLSGLASPDASRHLTWMLASLWWAPPIRLAS